MKKILTLIFLSAVTLLPLQEVIAQSFRYANEALLFSRTGLTGTARIRAMGGIGVALGGDISSAYTNPAGLGFYNRSEFSLSPGFFSSANDATYLGMDTYNYDTDFNISNIGLVLAGGKNDNTEGWLGGNFSLSYQQTNNFTDQFSYEGQNANNGLIDVLEENYISGAPDLLTDLAYSTYLVGDYEAVDETGEPYSFYTFVYDPTEDAKYLQSETVSRSGTQNEFNVAYGGNISDRFYIGAGLGFTSLDYRLEKNFTEEYLPEDDVTYFNVFEEQIVRGSGINASLGFIARALPDVTLGVTYKTPTIYSLEEDRFTELTVNYNDLFISDFTPEQEDEEVYLNGESYDFREGAFNYRLRTPGKLGLGAAYFVGKSGLISADVEFVDYSNNRLTDDDNSLREDNQAIQDDFTSVVNFRLGGEYRFDIFRLRAGYALQGDPYQNRDGMDRYSNILTGGAGLKFRNYYVDFAIARETGQQYYYPYTLGSESPLVNIGKRQTTAILTAGFTF
ncbi:OmpP1/FadL family transporter [Nafulsella turpanensis]|uniref:OmpP1/FadL family transporter n=1 Tax=Nafulsella turpanensis TaxID=1265690 RepID=UPI00034B5EC8|nr:hypothetical protein [Nafulsella turpanensis]